MEIKPYHENYLRNVYEIALQHGNAGEDASDLFLQKDLIGDVYAIPYTIHAPEYCLMLVDGDRALGYCVGALHTSDFVVFVQETWIERMRKKYNTQPASSFNARDKKLRDSLLNYTYESNTVIMPYISHLHINILKEAQGKGYGKRMIQKLLDMFRGAHSTGVHLGVDTNNLNAITFYDKIGFQSIKNNFSRKREETLMMGIQF